LPFVAVAVTGNELCGCVGRFPANRTRVDCAASTRSTRRALPVANETFRKTSALPEAVSVTVRLKSVASDVSLTSLSIAAASFEPHAPCDAATRPTARWPLPSVIPAASFAFVLWTRTTIAVEPPLR
jgi:hypothetical protein